MITPAFALTATERVLPRMALDFTTAVLDPRVTLTRSGNTATVINSAGTIVAVNANLPRFDYNPSTLVCNGLLIEESRTNVLLNSLIDGTILATQTVVVTAAARTLSFYGTGQIVLSGAHSATVTGTGVYPTRTTLTFTPSVGALTLTVTGTVQFAQLELGAFVTSFIPTAASQVTRNADVATMTGTNFSDWYNATEGSILCQGILGAGRVNNPWFVTIAGASADVDAMGMFWATILTGNITASSTTTFNSGTGASLVNLQPFKGVLAYKNNNSVFGAGGSIGTVDTSVTVASATRLLIGQPTRFQPTPNCWISKISYWPQRLTNGEVQAFSK